MVCLYKSKFLQISLHSDSFSLFSPFIHHILSLLSKYIAN